MMYRLMMTCRSGDKQLNFNTIIRTIRFRLLLLEFAVVATYFMVSITDSQNSKTPDVLPVSTSMIYGILHLRILLYEIFHLRNGGRGP